MPPGVLPSMRFASSPNSFGSPVLLSTATTDGSFSTMPSPFTYTRVLAVPRSTPMSLIGSRLPLLNHLIMQNSGQTRDAGRRHPPPPLRRPPPM